MSDDYEEADFEEEDFQESPEANTLTRYEEIVFCPTCDVYMPYKVSGAIVRRRCPECRKEFEGGQEVTPLEQETAASKASTQQKSPQKATPAPPAKAAPKEAAAPAPTTEALSCAAVTKAGTPCQNPPRSGSKYCSSHRGYRPPRK